MLNPNIFREYDIRGIADEQLPGDGITTLGRALGTFFRRKGVREINLGRDVRLSSNRLRDALVTGVKSAGCSVTDIGVVPTPLLYFSVFHLQAGGGVMITGSHNPAEYNGFKVMLGKSTIHGAEIQEVLRIIENSDYETGAGAEKSFDVTPAYLDDLAARFHFSRPVKVVADAGNGTAGPVAGPLLRRLGLDVEKMFFEPDGRFPNHHPDPTVPENLAALVRRVKETGAELGIAFDGDSDRIGAVDNTGRVIFGDQLMILYARQILARLPGATIIGEVKCSQSMYDDIRHHGGNAVMWKTGHSLIKSKMKETGAALAGEMSGHMFFADRYYGFDDAIYAACRLIEIVASSSQTLSEQLADLPTTVSTPEIRVDCGDDKKFGVVHAVCEHFKTLYEVIEVDGARINFARGWGLVRASNTQPILVMRFEAETPELLAAYRGEVERAAIDAQKL